MNAGRIVALLLCLCGCGGPGGVCREPGPGLVCPIAGTGDLGVSPDGLHPRDTDLYLVSAVRRGPDGRIWLMDFNSYRLRVIEDDRVVTIAGNGEHRVATTDGPALQSGLENPIDFAFLPDGQVVFTSYHDPRVLRVDADGMLRVVAGTGEPGIRGNEGDFEDPLRAQFMQLDGIAVAADGTIWVSDSMAHRVRRIRDGIITTVAGDGRAAYDGDGGPGEMAALNWPTALELDRDGALLIADSVNHAVRRLAPDGTITTLAGDGTEGFSGDGGPATAARLDSPSGLALGPDGALHIADRENFRIRRIAADGVIETVAGSGVEGLSGDFGPALRARFGHVARIALDGGALLVADQSNACARRVTLLP